MHNPTPIQRSVPSWNDAYSAGGSRAIKAVLPSKKLTIYNIDGQEYLATRKATLNGKEYQELHSLDIMRPDVLYIEKIGNDFKLVEDWDIYYALRKKYAIDEKSLDGELFLYKKDKSLYEESRLFFQEEIKIISSLKDAEIKKTEHKSHDSNKEEYVVGSGEHKGELLFTRSKNHNGETSSVLSDFFIGQANKELMKLYESDIKEFSEKGAKAFGHILEKRGISDPQKWFEEKIRVDTPLPYSYNPIFDDPNFVGRFSSLSGVIEFSSMRAANRLRVRAHETIHKIGTNMTGKTGRSGLKIVGVSERKNEKIGCNHHIFTVNGHMFNEGVTDLMTLKLLDLKAFSNGDGSYARELGIAKKVAKIVGEDTVFEAVLFDPQVLEKKWNQTFKNKYAYSVLIFSADDQKMKHLGENLWEKLAVKLDRIAFSARSLRVRLSNLCSKDIQRQEILSPRAYQPINPPSQVVAVERERVSGKLKEISKSSQSKITNENVEKSRKSNYLRIVLWFLLILSLLWS